MSLGLDATTVAALGLALDAASLRHQTIAANIANAGAVGYIRQRVSFEEQLQEVRRSLETNGKVDPFSLASVRPSVQFEFDATGAPANVRLDAEVADMAQNAVHYQALVKALSRHHAILHLAVGDGKK